MELHDWAVFAEQHPQVFRMFAKDPEQEVQRQPTRAEVTAMIEAHEARQTHGYSRKN